MPRKEAVARGFFNRWSTAMSLAPLGHVELADIDHIRAHALLTDAASLFAGTDNLIYPQWCLEGLARAAAARGDYERAAELDGARDALRSQTGVLLPPLHPAAYTRTLAVVRARLTTNGVRRGPRQAGRPDTAADHHGSLRRQELAAINISPLAIRARTGRSACRGTATTRLSPPRFVMRTSLRQGICQAARLKSRGLIRLRQYIALRRLLTRMVLSP